MKKVEFVERRKYIRFEAQTEIHFHISERSEEESTRKRISGITKNLSIQGVCFVSDKELEAGAVITLEVNLPTQEEPLLLEGEVRWSQVSENQGEEGMYETGVKLFTVDKADEVKFISYVNYKMKERLNKKIDM